MKSTSKSHLPKESQLLKFSRRLQNSVETGDFFQLPHRKRQVLVKRIQRLQRQLSAKLPGFKVSHAFALSTLVLGMAAGTVKAQPSYIAPVDTPFGLNTTGPLFLADIDFADLDNDGDLDAVVVDSFGYNLTGMMYLENTGSATAPAFTAPAVNPFDGILLYYFTFLDLVDLDNDGDIDLAFSTYDPVNYEWVFAYRENIGTATTPDFDTVQVNPFGISPGVYDISPEFADLDNDGDMDLFLNSSYGDFNYFENTGTATAPAFVGSPQTNPFGLTATYYINFPEVADFDRDGDLDVLAGAYYGELQYFENTGTAAAPAFAAPQVNPFGLTSAYYYALPTVADLDGDGDFDLVVGQYSYYGNSPFLYYEDTTMITSVPESVPVSLADFKVYPNPAQAGFTVSLTAGNGGAVGFELINGIGQIVQEAEWVIGSNGLRKQISVKGQPPGLYFVRLDTGDTPMVKKVMLR